MAGCFLHPFQQPERPPRFLPPNAFVCLNPRVFVLPRNADSLETLIFPSNTSCPAAAPRENNSKAALPPAVVPACYYIFIAIRHNSPARFLAPHMSDKRKSSYDREKRHYCAFLSLPIEKKDL